VARDETWRSLDVQGVCGDEKGVLWVECYGLRACKYMA
jgi:hypothetical protein